MTEKLQRIAKIMRLAGVIVLLGILSVAAFQLYTFYTQRVGSSADRTIESYFSALASGNYDEVYRLTAKEGLTDIYGRPITHDEFVEQLQGVTGGRHMPFEKVTATRLFQAKQATYYAVTLQSAMAGGSGVSRVLIEARRRDGAWQIVYPFAILL